MPESLYKKKYVTRPLSGTNPKKKKGANLNICGGELFLELRQKNLHNLVAPHLEETASVTCTCLSFFLSPLCGNFYLI